MPWELSKKVLFLDIPKGTKVHFEVRAEMNSTLTNWPLCGQFTAQKCRPGCRRVPAELYKNDQVIFIQFLINS